MPDSDERHEGSTFEHGTFSTGEAASADGRAGGGSSGGAVIADEDDEGFVAQLEAFEVGDELADDFVHVADIVVVEVFAGRGAIGGGQDFGVDVGEGVVDVEGLGAVSGDEVEYETVHEIGQIFCVAESLFFAVEEVGSGFGLGIPVGAAALELEVFVEAELGGSEGELAPFADGGGDVAGLLEDGGGHGFDGWLQETGGVLVGGTGAEGVASGEDEGAGGTAEGGGIGVGVAGAAAGELIDVRCFEVVGAVAT